jgi:hypothetical protein
MRCVTASARRAGAASRVAAFEPRGGERLALALPAVAAAGVLRDPMCRLPLLCVELRFEGVRNRFRLRRGPTLYMPPNAGGQPRARPVHRGDERREL